MPFAFYCETSNSINFYVSNYFVNMNNYSLFQIKKLISSHYSHHVFLKAN